MPLADTLQPARPAAATRVLVLVCVAVLVEVLFYSAITPLLPSYVEQFGLSTTRAGVLSGCYAAGTLLGSLPAGWLAARRGARGTLIGSLALLAAACFAFGLGTTYWALVAARFVQGAAGAGAWAAGLTWLVESAPRERRAQMIGSVLGVGVAGAVGGPVLGAAAHVAGPRPVFAAVGVVVVLLAAAAAVTPGGGEPAPPGRFRALLRQRRVLAGAWLTAVPTLLFGAAGVLVPLRLSALGLGATAVAGVFLVAAALEAGVSPVAGWLSDRRGPLLPSAIGSAGLLVAALLLPLPSSAAALAVVMVAGSSVSGALLTPASALLSEGAERVGAPQGLVFGVFNLAWALGQVGGSVGGARLADAAGEAVAYAAVAVLAALTLAGVLVAAARSRARRPVVDAAP